MVDVSLFKEGSPINLYLYNKLFLLRAVSLPEWLQRLGQQTECHKSISFL